MSDTLKSLCCGAGCTAERTPAVVREDMGGRVVRQTLTCSACGKGRAVEAYVPSKPDPELLAAQTDNADGWSKEWDGRQARFALSAEVYTNGPPVVDYDAERGVTVRPSPPPEPAAAHDGVEWSWEGEGP